MLAVAFIAGLFGRAVAFRQARTATTLEATATLLMLSDWFDRRLVVPGSLLVLLSGIVISWIGHWPLLTSTGGASWLLVSLILLLLPVGFIPSVLVPQRVRRQAALAVAMQVGRRTPELEAALSAPVVLRLRRLELAIVAVVFALMMLKPF
jgi:Predicted integral membrane protein (DUF2269)